MKESRMTPFNHALVWFGAAISIAEIITGPFFAPLGFKKALAAIVLGHLIGGLLMYLAGLIAAVLVVIASTVTTVGFGAYRYLMQAGFETTPGLTVPVMILTAALALLVEIIVLRDSKHQRLVK